MMSSLGIPGMPPANRRRQPGSSLLIAAARKQLTCTDRIHTRAGCPLTLPVRAPAIHQAVPSESSAAPPSRLLAAARDEVILIPGPTHAHHPQRSLTIDVDFHTLPSSPIFSSSILPWMDPYRNCRTRNITPSNQRMIPLPSSARFPEHRSMTPALGVENEVCERCHCAILIPCCTVNSGEGRK